MSKKKKTKKVVVVMSPPLLLREGEAIVYTAEFFKKQGAIGGRLGGKITADKLTPEERKAKAKKAIRTRWDKVKRKRKKESEN